MKKKLWVIAQKALKYRSKSMGPYKWSENDHTREKLAKQFKTG